MPLPRSHLGDAAISPVPVPFVSVSNRPSMIRGAASVSMPDMHTALPMAAAPSSRAANTNLTVSSALVTLLMTRTTVGAAFGRWLADPSGLDRSGVPDSSGPLTTAGPTQPKEGSHAEQH